MANILDRSTSYGVTQSLIDTAVFYGINMAGNKITNEIPRIGVEKTVIFLGADIAVRNNWISLYKDKFLSGGKGSVDMDNAYIATASFVIATVLDLVKEKELGKAIADNLIINALGMGGNIVVDNLMTGDKYK